MPQTLTARRELIGRHHYANIAHGYQNMGKCLTSYLQQCFPQDDDLTLQPEVRPHLCPPRRLQRILRL
jgi:hypothetical protein